MIALLLSVALAAKEPPTPACAPIEREVKSGAICKCACAWKTGAQRLKWKVTPKKIRAEGKYLCVCEVAPK